MWKAFAELESAGWIEGPFPRMYSVQSTGCAPIVAAFEAGRDRATPWPDPQTVASGLRVPGPLGDRLILAGLRESGGAAIAVTDEDLADTASVISALEGIDVSPEGGSALAAARLAGQRGWIGPEDRVVVFNTGAGWLYRTPSDLPSR
jgi:threonine synthase